MKRTHKWDASFYFRHGGRFVRLRCREERMQVKVRSGPWEDSTPPKLAALLSGSQLAHVYETSRNMLERRLMLQALVDKSQEKVAGCFRLQCRKGSPRPASGPSCRYGGCHQKDRRRG